MPSVSGAVLGSRDLSPTLDSIRGKRHGGRGKDKMKNQTVHSALENNKARQAVGVEELLLNGVRQGKAS